MKNLSKMTGQQQYRFITGPKPKHELSKTDARLKSIIGALAFCGMTFVILTKYIGAW